jgi:hypothetical protein
MDDYLSKPFTIRKLGETVARWIAVEPKGSGGPGDAGAEPGSPAKPSFSPIDQAVIDGIRERERVGGRGSLEQTINTYLAEASRRIEGLCISAEKGDAVSLLRDARALESGSTGVGAAGLSDLCRKIGERIRAGEAFAPGDPLLAMIDGEFHSVREALMAILVGSSA